MSIRLRLTLLYSAILALMLIGLSAALYFIAASAFMVVAQDRLTGEAQRLVASRSFGLYHIEVMHGRFTDPQTYVQTLTADGQVADRTPNLGDYVIPLSEAGRKACERGQTWSETVSTEAGRLLVYSRPVAPQGQTGILQLASSLVESDQSLATLRNILTSGTVVATLITFGLGWVLSGAALRPIDRLTQTARLIGVERDFGRRLKHLGPNDEIGRLTATLNTMLTELQSAYQQTEQSLHAQRRFVADASHELRTPLTTLRGNLGLLEREPPIRPEDRVAVLADTVEECDRLIRLVHNLLVLARADSGLTLKKEPVAMQPFIEELCRQARLLAPNHVVQCEPTVSATITADRDALKQVLLILLDNAIKYTPPHGQITLATALADQRLLIHIRDTGPGIPPEARPHLFERFYRVETSRTSAGTGLGLAIAKELIEAQGGAVSVASQVGQGSVFTVSLPVVSGPA